MRIALTNEMSLDGVVEALFSKKASDENPEQLAIGTIVELEHGLDINQAEKIARDHLEEDENYYTNSMEKNWGTDEAVDRVDELIKDAGANQIFVLDDDLERIDLFKQAYGDENVVVANNVKSSLNLLRSRKFAKVFLDRDLSSNTENGEDVAWQMKQEKLCQETPVVIHSENTRGQRVMSKYLNTYHSNVKVVPFRQLKKQLNITGGITLAKSLSNPIEESDSAKVPRRFSIEVTFKDGNTIHTTINGTPQEIKDYYLNNEFVDSDETTMLKPINVEILEDLGPVPSSYYTSENASKQTIASSTPDTRCPKCGIVGISNSECKFCHKYIPGSKKNIENQLEYEKFEPSWEKRLKKNELKNPDKRTASKI